MGVSIYVQLHVTALRLPVNNWLGTQFCIDCWMAITFDPEVRFQPFKAHFKALNKEQRNISMAPTDFVWLKRYNPFCVKISFFAKIQQCFSCHAPISGRHIFLVLLMYCLSTCGICSARESFRINFYRKLKRSSLK